MCNFSGMIKNVLPSLRQRAGPQRICSRQKSIRSGTARDSFSQTPHMRGKVIVDLVLTERHRITPAYAGKSRQGRSAPDRPRDHPRTCGEKYLSAQERRIHKGSPPHVRGKERDPAFNTAQQRITPAYAGKSHFVTSFHLSKRDHPRMCGEKRGRPSTKISSMGSPPHVRGKGLFCRCAAACPGITPACAGKRLHTCGRCGCPRDHPRMCGEKSTVYPTMLQIEGSPPHVRGKEVEHRAGVAVLRITPACAGKSQGLNIFHTKRSSGPLPAAVPAGPAGSCPASRPSQFPPRMTVIRPRP